MDFSKILTCLVENNYLCVRLDSNFELLTNLEKQKDVHILQDFRTFILDLDQNFEKYSLIYIHEFQRQSIICHQIIDEWYSRYKSGGKKLPYLLLGTYASFYTSVSLPLDKSHFLDFSKGKPKIRHSKDNFISEDDLDEKLYDRVSEIILKDIEKEKGHRSLVIVPTQETQDYLVKKLKDNKEHNVVKVKGEGDDIPESMYSTGKHTRNFIFVCRDMTRKPFFFEEIDTVYDSGEVELCFRTRSGNNCQRVIKIDKEMMNSRMMSYAPENYMIMFPRTSIHSLPKTKIPEHIRCDIVSEYMFLLGLGYCPSRLADSDKEEMMRYGAVKINDKKKMILTTVGRFCEMINLPLKHSSFIYKSISQKKNPYLAIVLVSIFSNIDLFSSKSRFSDIYYSIFRSIGSGEESEIPEEIFSSIQELCQALEVDKSIQDPEKELKNMLPYIRDHYKYDILKFSGGCYEDKRDNVYHMCNPKEISRIILPLTFYQNEKGEKFIEQYMGLDHDQEIL